MILLFSFFFSFSLPVAANVTLKPIITKGINLPVLVAYEPNNMDRLYIVEQTGKILTYENGVLKTFLDLSNQVTSGGEMGLLSMAFHPKYPTKNFFYINYTRRQKTLKTIISEISLPSKNERVILDLDQPYSNHNGGLLLFNQSGHLYIGTGDGGSGGDPHGHGQSKTTLLGKILRIDIDGALPYSVPKDNPFIDGSGRKEIFAYGLRNPWRFSFDKLTGHLIAADVGQNAREEIDLIEKGKNYGWNTMEGFQCYSPPENCEKRGLELPLYDYPPAMGNSITGGYVYRGKEIPELNGVYVYGDYVSGRIWGLHYDFSKKTFIKNELLLSTDLSISSFGEDLNGEILVVSHDGRIYRLSR